MSINSQNLLYLLLFCKTKVNAFLDLCSSLKFCVRAKCLIGSLTTSMDIKYSSLVRNSKSHTASVNLKEN